MKNGPELWDLILSQIPTAVIAGGAVRDFLLDVEPKDIDVFISAANFPSFNTEGWEPHPEAEEYEGVNHVDCVLRNIIEGSIVDLVWLGVCEDATIPFGQKVIDTFDFAITRCWYDGTLHDTFEAERDRRKKRVMLVNEARPLRIWRRFDRFNDSHGGDWTLIDRHGNKIERPKEEEIIF